MMSLKVLLTQRGYVTHKKGQEPLNFFSFYIVNFE